MNTMQQFEDLVRACIAKAEKAYGVDMSMVEIHLTLKGTTAGQSLRRRWDPVVGRYDSYGSKVRFQLYFNAEGIKNHWQYMTESNIPHEVAHMVGTVARSNGIKDTLAPLAAMAKLIKNHNGYWFDAAIHLSGKANITRTHSLPLEKSKQLDRHLYIIPATQESFRLTTILHNRIQKGQRRYSNRTKAVLLAEHYQGKCSA